MSSPEIPKDLNNLSVHLSSRKIDKMIVHLDTNWEGRRLCQLWTENLNCEITNEEVLSTPSKYLGKIFSDDLVNGLIALKDVDFPFDETIVYTKKESVTKKILIHSFDWGYNITLLEEGVYMEEEYEYSIQFSFKRSSQSRLVLFDFIIAG